MVVKWTCLAFLIHAVAPENSGEKHERWPEKSSLQGPPLQDVQARPD